MAESIGYPYKPDLAIPPGETIAELLAERGLSQTDFALKLGRSEKNVSQLINGKAPLGHDLAIDLERVFGVPAAVWNNLESSYRDLLARQAENERLTAEVAWTRQFPLKDMENRGFVARESDESGGTVTLLQFFGVASPEAHAHYWGSPKRLAARMTSAFTADIPALTAWLRQGEIAAQALTLDPYSSSVFREVVANARAMTLERIDESLPALQEDCAQAGVALVFVPELPGIRVSGVSRWLGDNRPLIELCLRYKTSDQLWFSFFHESCHILRHSKKRTWVGFLGEKSTEEDEANEFAADTLIPRDEWLAFVATGKPTKAQVVTFADGLGVHPGIVVGRLQHEGLVPFNQMNAFKQPLTWG